MMTEIALNVLDVAENSIKAKASLVTIRVEIDTAADQLRIVIDDDGCGMSPEKVAQVTDPFFTSRTTRKVGLGVPFFKMAAEMTGGSFDIRSEVGIGTTVEANFVLSSIDRMPLGDINETIYTLVVFNPDTDFLYIYKYDDREFNLDTRQLREILGDIPFSSPDVSEYIKEYLKENSAEVDQGNIV